MDIDKDAGIVLPKTGEFSDATSKIVYDDVTNDTVGTIEYTLSLIHIYHLLLIFRSTPKGFLRRLFNGRAAAFLSNLKKEFCFMTNAITYPAAYHVLSCEEMTYTEGGVGVVEAAMAWFPLYGWYKAVSAIHDYRKACLLYTSRCV